MSDKPYNHPGTMLISMRADVSQVEAIDEVRGGQSRSDFIRGAIDDRLCRFRVNGQAGTTDVRIVGRDKDQRLVVDDGGPLMTDGIDGEIVPNND